jgi:hypothetical protein
MEPTRVSDLIGLATSPSRSEASLRQISVGLIQPTAFRADEDHLRELIAVDVQGEDEVAISAEQVLIAAADEKWIEHSGAALQNRDQPRRGQRDQAQGDVVRMRDGGG